MRITSAANAQVKAIRKLRERKERQASGLYYVEGLRIVAEAVQQGAKIETLVTAPELLTSEFGQRLVDEQSAAGTTVLEVSANVFRDLSLKEGPVGIAAVVRQRWQPLETAQVLPGSPVVALDSVADPGNLGTIMRTLDAVGGKMIILLDHSTDPYDPTAMRASMGAVFTQRLIRTSFEEFSAWKCTQDAALVGTSDKARQDYHDYHYPDRLIILMGSEREGLSAQHLKACDEVVRIPMAGRSDSLNLAVATGIVLYEVYNQYRANSSLGSSIDRVNNA